MDNCTTILIVDDSPQNLLLLKELLSPDYKVLVAPNGHKAIEIANGKIKPDLILLDIMMPNLDGFDVCGILKANPLTQMIPIIFVTAKSETIDEEKGFNLGAVDYITKPISPPILKARVKTHLSLLNHQRDLEQQVDTRTSELKQTQLKIIKRLGRAAEFKDNETGLHVIRMARFARLIAKQLNAPERWCQLLYQAAPMHDVGKIGIPESILGKPGKLTDEERKIMQTHSKIGADIIGIDSSELLILAREVALFHHEKWDGSGYPHQLEAEDIPLSARIVAVADVFDALTSCRPYKKAWSIERATDLIKEESGKHFDPAVVQAFIRCLPEILEERNALLD
ncbi:response regulator [Vibrio lamellibrachiae]|uniref:HD domain-containing phosphohydrolase n=1 Tax=Vibrio lamellibrachiae TaxID=2910253 RepID=UPI003D135DE1